MSASSEKSEDSLVVYLNQKSVTIYELDTMESFKLRIASEWKDETRKVQSILPELIILEEKVQAETEEVKISGKSAAGCKAVHVKNPELERINPLAKRQFKVLNFAILSRLRIESAGLDPKKHRDYAMELIKLFDLTGKDKIITTQVMEMYVIYAIYFGFGGLEMFENARATNPTVASGLISAARDKNGLGIGNFDIIRLHWDSAVSDIKKKLKAINAEVEKDSRLFSEYRKHLADYETITSNLQLDKTHLNVKFKIASDIYQLFDDLVLNPMIPFAALGDFYKVLKTFKPPKLWAVRCPVVGKASQVATKTPFMRDCESASENIQPGNEVLVLYVFNRFVESQRNKESPDPHNYSTVFIIPQEEDEKTHETSVEMRIQSRIDDELKEEKLLSRIFDTFVSPITHCIYEQQYVEADFLLPSNQEFDVPLFHDMVLTDPLINKIMLINESAQTFRERGGVFAYFRYNSHVPSKDFLSCRINPGIVEAKDQARAPDIFRILGKKLLRIKLMNCKNYVEAQRFRDLLCQIIEYYYG
jgi:hypothetical protein